MNAVITRRADKIIRTIMIHEENFSSFDVLFPSFANPRKKKINVRTMARKRIMARIVLTTFRIKRMLITSERAISTSPQIPLSFIHFTIFSDIL